MEDTRQMRPPLHCKSDGERKELSGDLANKKEEKDLSMERDFD